MAKALSSPVAAEVVPNAGVAAGADLAERFLILPRPEVGELLAGKAADPEGWLRQMQHLQAGVSTRASQASPAPQYHPIGGAVSSAG